MNIPSQQALTFSTPPSLSACSITLLRSSALSCTAISFALPIPGCWTLLLLCLLLILPVTLLLGRQYSLIRDEKDPPRDLLRAGGACVECLLLTEAFWPAVCEEL